MTLKYVLCALAAGLFSCSAVDTPTPETTYQVVDDLDYDHMLARIGEEKLLRGVEQPDAEGALGRNKEGYFHVRFQVNMTSLSDYVVESQRIDGLEYVVSTVAYAFNHQEADGGFELVIPAHLLNSSDYTAPTEGDLASGTAFFASSLGITLLSLESSPWFVESTETEALRTALRTYDPAIERTLDYLLTHADLLKQYDAQAPNRLLFDALAYYSLGKYLDRADAIVLAQEFMELALVQTDAAQGYFIEGGGWDSSYNGVAIKLAMELYLLADEAAIKSRLAEAFIRATAWQLSRIAGNGEVSTDGNTRVYAGGESFLGNEKGVDYVKVVRALYYFGYLTDHPEVVDLGDRVLDFYH